MNNTCTCDGSGRKCEHCLGNAVKTLEQTMETNKDATEYVMIANLVFAGLSVEQMNKIPKWLLENIEKNTPSFIAQAEARGAEKGREKINKIVVKWMKTSNPAHAQDLFDALKESNHSNKKED